MPIGKNSLKRVANGGYSNVKTSAPDMENSTELLSIEEPKAEPPKKTADKPKPPARKTTSKTAAKPSSKGKSDATKKKSAPAKESTAAPVRQGSCYINIGGELPIYLL